MPIVVNGTELNDAEVEEELALHQDSDNPLHAAVTARILRIVMLDEAKRLGLPADDEEQAIGALLESQAASNAPDEAACQRFYQANLLRFTVGACVEADHILFQVTPQVDLEALRSKAEAVLQEALAAPERFGELAQTYSNCPSAKVGGSLGQLSRGDSVPEFERVLFQVTAGTVHPNLIHSRHGMHIVRVTHAEAGRQLPFEMARAEIEQVLTAMARDTAWRQYLKVLVSRAQIEGIDLAGMAEGENIMGAGFAHGQHEHEHAHAHEHKHAHEALMASLQQAQTDALQAHQEAHQHEHFHQPSHAGCTCGGGGNGQGGCA
ncbi:peptidylprolyl isomerase [Lampropedia puyangensis]|uniref:peptidylprolyl isomerase n=1 Tax=Lampropedia puyangensis TaxID=1330072 RepID=A0A4S8EVD2_9BURK|nr:peptidylprolyl isomerase [Lampropedia puyangensis]